MITFIIMMMEMQICTPEYFKRLSEMGVHIHVGFY